MLDANGNEMVKGSTYAKTDKGWKRVAAKTTKKASHTTNSSMAQTCKKLHTLTFDLEMKLLTTKSVDKKIEMLKKIKTAAEDLIQIEHMLMGFKQAQGMAAASKK